MHEALASVKNIREFIDDFLCARKFEGSKIESDRVLYLVYREKWAADDNGSFDRTKNDFLSYAVWIDVVEWFTRRDDASKKQLMQCMSWRLGYENAWAKLFRELCINIWKDKASCKFDLHCWTPATDGSNSKVMVDDESVDYKGTAISINWVNSRAILRSELPTFELNTFYFEEPIQANLPLFDALIIVPGTCYLLQITRSKRHSVNLECLESVVEKLPREVDVLAYIIVCPHLEILEVEVSHTTMAEGQECAGKYGKKLEFFVAEVKIE